MTVKVGQQNQENRSHAAGVAPTGTYTDWNWPGQNYTSFDWLVTPGIDQSGPDAYFYSHQFGLVNGDGGYSGLQGDANGKRAIFSIWQALTAQGPEIARTFGGEGVGYQTIISYNWIANRTYKFHLVKEMVEADGTWWSSTVTDQITGVSSLIGKIKVPPAWGGLGNWSVVWTERYGGSMSACSDIHSSSVVFSNVSANNGSVLPNSHNNHLANPINCPGSLISDVSGGVKHEMGIGNLIVSSPSPSASPSPTSTPVPTFSPAPTQTPVVVPTSTPTSTPVPSSTILGINLLFHGIGRGGDSSNPNSGGNNNPKHSQRRVNIEVLNANNQVILTKDGFVNYNPASGNFMGTVNVGNSVPTGIYTLKIKSDQFLRSLVPGIQTITQGKSIAITQTILKIGDMNNDNSINALDYNILMDCYSDLTPPHNCSDVIKKQSADITDEGDVNQFDYNLFIRELTNINGE